MEKWWSSKRIKIKETGDFKIKKTAYPVAIFESPADELNVEYIGGIDGRAMVPISVVIIALFEISATTEGLAAPAALATILAGHAT